MRCALVRDILVHTYRHMRPTAHSFLWNIFCRRNAFNLHYVIVDDITVNICVISFDCFDSVSTVVFLNLLVILFFPAACCWVREWHERNNHQSFILIWPIIFVSSFYACNGEATVRRCYVTTEEKKKKFFPCFFFPSCNARDDENRKRVSE